MQISPEMTDEETHLMKERYVWEEVDSLSNLPRSRRIVPNWVPIGGETIVYPPTKHAGPEAWLDLMFWDQAIEAVKSSPADLRVDSNELIRGLKNLAFSCRCSGPTPRRWPRASASVGVYAVVPRVHDTWMVALAFGPTVLPSDSTADIVVRPSDASVTYTIRPEGRRHLTKVAINVALILTRTLVLYKPKEGEF